MFLRCALVLMHVTHAAAAGIASPTLRVGVVQQLVLGSDREGNYARLEQGLAQATSQGAQLVTFPETAILGWDNPFAWNASFPIPGKDTDRLSALAAKYGTGIVVGIAERVNASVLHDSAVLIDSDGTLLHTHRKINILTKLMDPPYVPGEMGGGNIAAVATKCCGRVGVLICADTFQDNILAAMAAAKPDVVAVPYGWSGCPEAAVNPKSGILDCEPLTDRWPQHGLDLIERVHIVANTTGAPTLGADCVGQQLVGPWRGQTYGGWSNIAIPGVAQAAAVAADRNVDVIVATVPLGRA